MTETAAMFEGAAVVLVAGALTVPAWTQGAADPAHRSATDRGEKMAAIIPGRRTPRLPPETLFARWTAEQVARWTQDHPQEEAAGDYERHAVAEPTSADPTTDYPVHILP